MLLLKANPELKQTFEKLIRTMKLPVTWTDLFVIANNNLILAGEVRSLVFNFDNKRASTTIMEFPSEGAQLERMPGDALLNNVMNIVLYAFGKWGVITGLTVEKDYPALNALFAAVLRPLKIEPGYTEDNFHFYQNGRQVTYEDVMLAVLRLLRSEGKLKEGQSLATSEMDDNSEADNNDDSDEDNTSQSNPSDRQAIEEYEDEDDYEIGLWHNLCWKKETYSFEKVSPNKEEAAKSRIGNNFYITNYLCPKCQENIYMGVYPTNKELLIETEEGRVFMARAYTCRNCNIFYTPRPQKLLQEGDVYHLEFDQDTTAYEDYLNILGKRTERTSNHNFNEFESERNKEKASDSTPMDISSSDASDMWNTQTDHADSQAKQDTSAQMGLKNLLSKGRKKLFQKADKKQSAETLEAVNPGQTSIPSGQKERLPISSQSDLDSDIAGTSQTGTVTAESSHTGQTRANAFGTVPYQAQMDTSRTETTKTQTDRSSRSKQSSSTSVQVETAQAESTQAESRYDKTKLAGKTTEELKSILARMEQAGSSVTVQESNSTDPVYLEAVKETLQNKLTAKYDARMGALQNLSLKQLSDLRNQVTKETVLPETQKGDYISKIDSLLYQAEKTSLDQKVESSKSKTYAEIGRMIEEIEKSDVPEELKQEAIVKLERVKADRATREVEHLMTHIPLHLDRKQLSAYLSKLDQYEGVDITPYREQLEQRKDLAEKEEISAMIKRGGKKDRKALWNLYNQLQEQGYKQENKAPFLEKLYDAIRKMDEAQIDKICPSITSLSFAEGLKAYAEIESGMFLPELKTNTLEMIKRRLTRLKTDESVQLMRKLKHDMEESMSGLEHFYFYDAREEQRIAQGGVTNTPIWNDELEEKEEQEKEKVRTAMLNAINSYAAGRGTYEYPLMVCDTSRSENGKEGFVLTPDHIFYHTLLHSGDINITNVESIQVINKLLFGKGIYVRRLTGGKEKLPHKVKQEDWEAFTKVLDDFVSYLQDRPESRSLEYMAKEKHEVIHCYRCGFVYKGGTVCPKCGSKMNR